MTAMGAHAVRICVSTTAQICHPEASFALADLDINLTRRTRTPAMVCDVILILSLLEDLNIYNKTGLYRGIPDAGQDNGNFCRGFSD